MLLDGRLGWYFPLLASTFYQYRQTDGTETATHAAYLMTLSLAPALHYSHTYQPSHAPLLPTLTVATLIDAASIYIPLRFLRISPKSVTPPKPEPQATRLLTALLSSSIYQLVLYSSAKKFLSSWLLTCGWDIESVERVHDASEAVLLVRALMMMPVGWAVSNIISYSPSDSPESTITMEPTPGNANLRDYSGVWGCIVGLWMKKLSPRTRKIVKRTLLIAGYQSISSVVGLAGTVKGGNMAGAAGISGVWTAATMAVGVVLYWVGKV